MAVDGADLAEEYPHVVGTGVRLEVRPGRVKAQPKVIMPPGPVVPKVIPPIPKKAPITIPPIPKKMPKKAPKQPVGPPPPHLIISDEAEKEGKQDLQIVISLI